MYTDMKVYYAYYSLSNLRKERTGNSTSSGVLRFAKFLFRENNTVLEGNKFRKIRKSYISFKHAKDIRCQLIKAVIWRNGVL